MKVDPKSFKNSDVRELVKECMMFSNLMLNDVPQDKGGNVVVKKTKESKPGRVPRGYYNATFLSLENISAARTVTFFQNQNADGSLVWKNINPVIVINFLGKTMDGFIAKLTLTQDIPYVIGGVTTLSNKLTIFVPNLEVLEETLHAELTNHGLIEVEVKETAVQGSEVNAGATGGMNTPVVGEAVDNDAEMEEELEGAEK